MQKPTQKAISAGKNYEPEIYNIKEDLQTLKADASNLVQHVVADGQEKLREAGQITSNTYESLKSIGARQLKKAELEIKAKPIQSIAVAFGVGLVASFLLGRR